MQSQNHWLLPEGIEQILPDEARRLEQLRRQLLDLFALWGYQQVIPPFIDFIESLLTATGHELDIQTFKLTDQISGRQLGIRADMTPQVARIDAHHLACDKPNRLCYLGTVLRTQGDHLAKSRSLMQIGAELYGHAGIESDLEVLQLMLEMLAVAGLQDVHIDLGHVAIFRALIRSAGLSESLEAEIFELLQRKARPELEQLLNEIEMDDGERKMLASLIDLNGHSNVLERAKDRLAPAGGAVIAAVDDLDKIARQLRIHYPALTINFDLAELRGYHYQTGTVFAAYVPGYGREIARGGRYDEFGRLFGRARPATGFSADLKVVAMLAERSDQSENGAVFSPLSDDYELAVTVRDLRASGRVVIQQLPGQSGDAEAMNCCYRLEKKDMQWTVVPLSE